MQFLVMLKGTILSKRMYHVKMISWLMFILSFFALMLCTSFSLTTMRNILEFYTLIGISYHQNKSKILIPKRFNLLLHLIVHVFYQCVQSFPYGDVLSMCSQNIGKTKNTFLIQKKKIPRYEYQGPDLFSFFPIACFSVLFLFLLEFKNMYWLYLLSTNDLGLAVYDWLWRINNFWPLFARMWWHSRGISRLGCHQGNQKYQLYWPILMCL